MPSEYFCILENLPDNKPQYTLYPSHHFIWLPHAPTIQKVLQKKHLPFCRTIQFLNLSFPYGRCIIKDSFLLTICPITPGICRRMLA